MQFYSVSSPPSPPQPTPLHLCLSLHLPSAWRLHIPLPLMSFNTALRCYHHEKIQNDNKQIHLHVSEEFRSSQSWYPSEGWSNPLSFEEFSNLSQLNTCGHQESLPSPVSASHIHAYPTELGEIVPTFSAVYVQCNWVWKKGAIINQQRRTVFTLATKDNFSKCAIYPSFCVFLVFLLSSVIPRQFPKSLLPEVRV